MKETVFERYDTKGNFVDKHKRTINTTWDDPTFTLKHFIAYLKIVERLEESNKKFEAGESIDSEDENDLRVVSFFADMIVVLTGLEKEFVYTMNAKEIVALYNTLEFTQDKLPKGHCTDFWFKSATDKVIAINEKHYKQVSFLKPKLKAKAKLELAFMKKSHFTLKGDMNNVQLRKWISTRGVLNKIKAIKSEMSSGNFENYAQIIAYIVEKNGQVMTIKESQKLAIVFEDLPFTVAYNMVNFFLNVQSVLSSNTQQYLMKMAAMVRTKPRPPKNKN